MDKENIKNIEFVSSDVISKLNLLSVEYSVSFDTLVNLAVLEFIKDINTLRLARTGNLDLLTLSEQVLSL